MVMEFYPGKEYGNNETNWWAPTLFCLMNMIKASGFTDGEVWKFTNPQQLSMCRGFVKGKK
jgi:tRNA (mo5U34)-methyltransferase